MTRPAERASRDAPDLMTLEQAAARYAHLGVTLAGLRRARREGRLRCGKPGRSYVVSDREIRRYLCLAPESPRACGGAPTTGAGSSSTAGGNTGRDMLETSIARLKARSQPTSPRGARPAPVIPLRS